MCTSVVSSRFLLVIVSKGTSHKPTHRNDKAKETTSNSNNSTAYVWSRCIP